VKRYRATRRRWLARCAWLGLVGPSAAIATRAAEDPLAEGASTIRRGTALAFPRDDGAHLRTRIEWWYLSGWLGEPAAPRLGFQLTFFRSRTGLAADNPSRFAARQLLFAHAALTELAAGRHRHGARLARWNGDPHALLAHAAPNGIDLRLGDWRLAETTAAGPGGPALAARFGSEPGSDASAAFTLELRLERTGPRLLQGDAGFSRKGADERHASFYVSEPQLALGATLARRGRRERLAGRGWLDHEWSDELLADDTVGWDWIGINLDDGAALTAFQLRRADGSAAWAGGSWRAAGQVAARAFAADELAFDPGRRWQSPATGASYPVEWRLETPFGRHRVRALLAAQELDARGGVGSVYWEGLAELLDSGGRRVGLGYLEMTGYAGRLRLGP
jgi:predicted secreted hydrolase